MKTGNRNRLSNFEMILNHVKPYFMACSDSDTKQYILYFLYVRAKMHRVKYDIANGLIEDVIIEDYENGTLNLEIYQIENAKKGYTDEVIIPNKTFVKKTGIIIYSADSHTAREYVNELKKEETSRINRKRMDLLRRLVRRKENVTVDEILMYFKKHNVGISKSTFYNNRMFVLIRSEFYKNGSVKIVKNGDRYVFKST